MDTTTVASLVGAGAPAIPSPIAQLAIDQSERPWRYEDRGIEVMDLTPAQQEVALRVAREVEYDAEGDVACVWSPTQVTLNGSYSLGQLRGLVAVLEALQAMP